MSAFGILLGGVPPLDDDVNDNEQVFVDAVLHLAREKPKSINEKLAVRR